MRWSKELKEQARDMRLSGVSFGVITKKLHVAKSTLHSWVRDIERPKRYRDRKVWLATIRPLAAEAIKQKRLQEIDNIIQRTKLEVEQWGFLQSVSVQKALLSLLYWAEGQKLPERGAPVKFANTDPRLILLFVTLLKRCYKIDDKKIKVHLYIHWYHKESEVKEFWKKLLHLENSQFRKTYRKKRSITKRFRKNFMGICFVIYQDVNLRQEIVHTAHAVQEKIVSFFKNAPVA